MLQQVYVFYFYLYEIVSFIDHHCEELLLGLINWHVYQNVTKNNEFNLFQLFVYWICTLDIKICKV